MSIKPNGSKSEKSTFLLLFFALPIVLILLNFKDLLDPYTVPRLIIWSLWNIFGLIYIFKNNGTFTFNKSARIISYLLLTYLVLSLLSYSQSINKAEFFFESIKLFTFLISIGIYSILFKTKPYTRTLFYKSLCITLLIACAFGLYDLIQYDFSTIEDFYQIKGNLGHKNQYSAFLALTGCFSFILVNNKSRIWRNLSISALTLSAFLILLLQTRSILLGISIAALVSIILIIAKKLPNPFTKSNLIKFSVIVTIPIILTLLFSSKHTWYKNEIFSSFEKINKVDNINYANRSINERGMLWNKTFQMIKDAPLLGVGIGNWKIQFPKYGLENTRAYTGYVNFLRPHNDYLWIASEIGLPGLLIYLLFILMISWYALKYVLASNNKLESLGILAFIILFSIFSLFSFPKERTLLLYLFSVEAALIISLIPSKKELSFSGKGLTIGAITLLLICLVGLKQRYTGDYYAKKLYYDDLANDRLYIHEYVNKAKSKLYTISTIGLPIDFYRGKKDFIEGRQAEALTHYQNAYKETPYQIHVINDLASVYNVTGNFTEAENLYKKALSINPKFDEAILNYAITLYQKRRITEAFDIVITCPNNTLNSNYENILTTITLEKIRLLTEGKNVDPKLNQVISNRPMLFQKMKNYPANIDLIEYLIQ